jgi:hypothetical protein
MVDGTKFNIYLMYDRKRSIMDLWILRLVRLVLSSSHPHPAKRITSNMVVTDDDGSPVSNVDGIDHADDPPYVSVVYEISWQVMWTKAFPTLLSFHLYCDEPTAPHLRVIAYHEIIDPRQESAPEQTDHVDEWSDSLGYGEITCQTVFQVISWLQEHRPDFSPKSVVDLGSGNGRVIIAASLAFPFEKSIGIEIVPHLHNEAMNNLRIWNERSVSLTNNGQQRLHYHLADFTLDPSKIHDSDLIIIHATVFRPSLMMKLQELCGGCQSGTYFVVVSQPLIVGRGIRTINEFRMEMSWGEAMVCIQQKVKAENDEMTK